MSAAVVEHLEWFKDQKFGLFMHFGVYSELGIIESWPLSDRDSRWSRRGIEWAQGDEIVRHVFDAIADAFQLELNGNEK